MPARLFSDATCLLKDLPDQGHHIASLPWEPLPGPHSRGQCSRTAAAFLGIDGEVQCHQRGVRAGSSKVPSAFNKAKWAPTATDPLHETKPPKNAKEEREEDDARQLEYSMRDGRKVPLCADNVECCKQDCKLKAIPHKADVAGSAQGSTAMAALGESEKTEQQDCAKFCDNEFYCFPGDSTVVVRHRGRVALEDLREGDVVLSLRPASNESGWKLCFDEVLTFLHRDPDTEAEFMRVRHELGQVHLSANHLLFAQSDSAGTSRVAAPIFAKDVRVGDRVLAPWIDGDLTAPKVLEIEVVRKRGLYAPLLETGALMVDGTAASCYAIPENLKESAIYKKFSEVASASSLQATCHALLKPLRLACRAQSSVSETALVSKDVYTAVRKNPHAWGLYVTFSSLLA